MLSVRVIPVLLLKGGGLYKTVAFRNPTYVGDPINAVRIFNDKEADELILLDIGATREGRGPNFSLIADVASECFMPLCYGGGVRALSDIEKLFSLGVEKVAFNTLAHERPDVIKEASVRFGSQSIVVVIDYRRDFWGRSRVYSHCGQKRTNWDPLEYAQRMEERGAGELVIYSMVRDGTMKGYDLPTIRSVSRAVGIPVVACGGAGCFQDFRKVLAEAESVAVAAGSLFVFQGPHRAVLISYPDRNTLEELSAPK